MFSIVFVHGLGGDRVRTWSSTPSDDDPETVFWPKDLLPSVYPQARSHSFGYDASFAQFWPWQDIPLETTLDDHSTALFQNVAGVRNQTNTSGRPIIFVAHSLGGLVVANALARQHGTEAGSKDIQESFKGTVFLGTPFEGSDKAKLGNIALRILRLVTSTNDKVKDLEKRSGKDYLDVACFFEEYPTRIATKDFGLIVDKSSATVPGVSPHPIPASHSGMCKFAFKEHAGFRSVSEKLCQWIKALESPTSEAATRVQTSAVQIGDTIFREKIDNNAT